MYYSVFGVGCENLDPCSLSNLASEDMHEPCTTGHSFGKDGSAVACFQASKVVISRMQNDISTYAIHSGPPPPLNKHSNEII